MPQASKKDKSEKERAYYKRKIAQKEEEQENLNHQKTAFKHQLDAYYATMNRSLRKSGQIHSQLAMEGEKANQRDFSVNQQQTGRLNTLTGRMHEKTDWLYAQEKKKVTTAREKLIKEKEALPWE